MKRFTLAAFAALFLAFGAFASGELVATGADVRSWRVGAANGTALTNTLTLSRTVCPWKIYVTNAVKRASSTASVFTPTNYVVTASFVATNTIPVWTDFERTVTNLVYVRDWTATNGVVYSTNTYVRVETNTNLSVTNYVLSAVVTNSVGTIDGIAGYWTCIATNGITSTVTNFTTAAAGGTVTLGNSYGDTWSVSLSSGAGQNASGDPNLSKLVFPGDLWIKASDAEELTVHVVYLTFQR